MNNFFNKIVRLFVRNFAAFNSINPIKLSNL